MGSCAFAGTSHQTALRRGPRQFPAQTRGPFRLVDIAPAPTEQEGEASALPEFLSDDEERDVAADDDRPRVRLPNEITSREGSGCPHSSWRGPAYSVGYHFY
jgi:hypothetical protein